jgi:hypothetical protein
MKSIMRKLTADMTFKQKEDVFLSEPDIFLTINLHYIDLLNDLNQELANKFIVMVDDERVINGKVSAQDVEEIYRKFLNKKCMDVDDEMNIDSDTKADCALDLMLNYGRYASNRLSKACNGREQSLNRKLQREEILELYREIKQELARKERREHD